MVHLRDDFALPANPLAAFGYRVHYDEGFGLLFDRTPRREARAAGHGEAR
jgi:hypothetical protein